MRARVYLRGREHLGGGEARAGGGEAHDVEQQDEGLVVGGVLPNGRGRGGGGG